MRSDTTYRRRRFGALLAGATAACILYAGTNAGADGTSTAYTVARGETLWSIATDHYPRSEDPRVRISEIREMNHLEDYGVRAGERLKLPSR